MEQQYNQHDHLGIYLYKSALIPAAVLNCNRSSQHIICYLSHSLTVEFNGRNQML